MTTAEPEYSILLAEDDIDDQYLVQMGLKDLEFPVNLDFAPNGQVLLQRLNSDTVLPDLVMLDLNMPGIDGVETLKMIKQEERWNHIPVIIYTTSDKDEDVEICYQNGANSYIVKPLSFEEVVKTLNYLCHYWFKVVRRKN